jgi:hypothetical protein
MFLSPFLWRLAFYFFPPTYEPLIQTKDQESTYDDVLLSFERRGSTGPGKVDLKQS